MTGEQCKELATISWHPLVKANDYVGFDMKHAVESSLSLQMVIYLKDQLKDWMGAINDHSR